MNTYSQTISVSRAEPSARAMFIRRTYGHLAGAILLFICVEAYLLQPHLAEPILRTFLGGKYSWLIVLGAFMGVSYLANWWATNQSSVTLQYFGLILYVIAEAVIFVPMIYITQSYAPDVIPQAAVVTLSLFGGLTAVVFMTRKDFNFLGPILTMVSFVALGLIVSSILFGFTLGSLFSAVMIIFAAGAILYSTSNVMLRYHTGQHVAASLSLFASVALLFWYIIRLLSSFSRN